MSEVRLDAEPRTEFGKGAARRTRKAGKIPAVLYGHGTDPTHVSLPALEFARAIREHGQNTVLTLRLGSDGSQLALTKTITTHPLKNYIEHVDLLLVRSGEKVVVDIPVVITGIPASNALVTQDASTLQVAAEALHIPEQFEVSVAEAAVGTQILARHVELPDGVQLHSDPDMLVVNVVASPTEQDMAGEVEAAEETLEAEPGETADTVQAQESGERAAAEQG